MRALWLEGNMISVIENLEPCKKLRCLFVIYNYLKCNQYFHINSLTSLCFRYLQENQIEKIEGLKRLVELDTLDLNHNLITKIENLKYTTQLHTLNLSHNLFALFSLA